MVMRRVKNLRQAKGLARQYERISLKRIEQEWNKPPKNSFFTIGSGVANNLFGFGQSSTCTLCKAVGKKGLDISPCNNCIYRFEYGCLNPVNRETYSDINNALTPNMLYDAFRARAKRLREAIKEYEEELANKA